jgi:voltage-gated potassium channel
MTEETSEAAPSGSPNYEIFILALSVLSIVNILLIILPIFTGAEHTVIEGVDAALCVVFMGDFIFRITKARHKSHFFFRQHGWLDLIGSLPLPGLRVARVFRMWRAGNMIRETGIKQLWRSIISGRAGSAMYMAIFLVVVVLEFGGISVLIAEGRSDNANIKTGSDALWWAYVTVTTVGYGDRYPVTNWGRFVGVLVMTVGVGLFGVLTGFLANAFLVPRSESKPPDDGRIDAILARLETIERLLSREDQPDASTAQARLSPPELAEREGLQTDYKRSGPRIRQDGERGPASAAI